MDTILHWSSIELPFSAMGRTWRFFQHYYYILRLMRAYSILSSSIRGVMDLKKSHFRIEPLFTTCGDMLHIQPV